MRDWERELAETTLVRAAEGLDRNHHGPGDEPQYREDEEPHPGLPSRRPLEDGGSVDVRPGR